MLSFFLLSSMVLSFSSWNTSFCKLVIEAFSASLVSRSVGALPKRKASSMGLASGVPKEENFPCSDSNTTATLAPVRVERSDAALKSPERLLKNVRLRSLPSSMNLTPDLLSLLGIMEWRTRNYYNQYLSKIKNVFL
jgi:hypothetical protein